jgi:hypothetical protein
MDMVYSIYVPVLCIICKVGVQCIGVGVFPLWRGGWIWNVSSLLKAEAGSHWIYVLSSLSQLWHHPSKKIKLSKTKSKTQRKIPIPLYHVSLQAFLHHTVLYSTQDCSTKLLFVALSGTLHNPQQSVPLVDYNYSTVYTVHRILYMSGTSGGCWLHYSTVQVHIIITSRVLYYLSILYFRHCCIQYVHKP